MRVHDSRFAFAFPFVVAVLGLGAAGLGAQGPEPRPSQEPEVATDPAFRELKGALLPGIPELPAYPGAALIGSAERNRPEEPNRGYRVKWRTIDSPKQVIAWYETAFAAAGWKCVALDLEELDELELEIAGPEFIGYVEAESEPEDDVRITDIVIVLERR
jgi:hypothetical protein